jgi:hypothetical protein
MYRGKNKFEVMYNHEQVQYEAEHIMGLLISHIMYVYYFKRIYKMKIAMHTI